MIITNRRKVRRPKFFSDPEFRKLADQLREFYRQGGTGTSQEWFHWRERLEPFLPSAMDTLNRLFHGKCCYTEEFLGSAENGEMVLHRPPGDAMGIDGMPSPEHYWWLIVEWSNWYLASHRVSSVKATQFPVLGERAKVPSGKSPYRVKENSLLLDPCSTNPQDNPAWHLAFWRTGKVGVWDIKNSKDYGSMRLPSRSDLPGVATVKVLDLNNSHLVKARNRAAAQSRRILKELLAGDPSHVAESPLFSDSIEFSAAVRQACALRILTLLNEKSKGRSDYINRKTLLKVVDKLKPELAAPIICRNPRQTFSNESQKILMPIRKYVKEVFPGDDVSDRFLAGLQGRRFGEGETLSSRPKNWKVASTLAPYNIEPERPLVGTTAQIRSFHIKNFKAIKELALNIDEFEVDDFQADDSQSQADAISETSDPYESRNLSVTLMPEYGSLDQREIKDARRWWSFLGENGSGKSSILQALGLALAGDNLESVIAEAGLDWGKLLRRVPVGSNEKFSQGRIYIEFSGGTRIDLRFNKNKHWWVPDMSGAKTNQAEPEAPRSGKPEIKAFIRAYGATRLLEKESNISQVGHVRVANLFDPRANVLNAKEWLMQLSDHDFNVAAPTITGLLNLDHKDQLLNNGGTKKRQPKKLRFVRNKAANDVYIDNVPLEMVSDGYRAVVALACDIMAGLAEGFSTIEHATGIVLIDEIGAHLHPSWRMSITRKLRRALPRVQFIVSTHEPLCLRGLFGREVVRVEKHPQHGVMIEVVERDPSQLRVDQLLTSEFFGLDTTIDPDLERRFQHYYRLLAIDDDERTPEQKKDLNDLFKYLQHHARPTLGFTRRDQLVYDEIDRYLSSKHQRTNTTQTREQYIRARKKRRRQALENVRNIWDRRLAGFSLESEQ